MINRLIIICLPLLMFTAMAIGCEQEKPAPAASAAAETADDSSSKMDQAVDAVKDAASKSGEAAKTVAGEAAEAAKEKAVAVGDSLSQAADKTGEALKDAAIAAADKVGAATDKVGDALDSAADKAKDFANGLRSSSEENSVDSALALEKLAHHKFILRKVNGSDYNSEPAPFIEFGAASTMVSGKVCNTFQGPAALTDGVLTVKPLASTRMLCSTDGLDKLETKVFAMLDQGAEVSFDGSRLTLKRDGDTLIFESE